MKRSIFFLLALAAACFAVAVSTDVIEFASDRTDRRVIIVSVGAVVGLAALGFGSTEQAAESDEPAGGRAAAARRLQSGRLDPDVLPAKPGSLLKKRAEAESAHNPLPVNETRLDHVDLIDDSRIATAASINEIVEEIDVDPAPFAEAVPVPAAGQNGLDQELVELIDEEQMLEINDLVAAALASDAEEISGEITPVGSEVEPLKRLELRLADYDDDDLQRVVKESEAVVIAEMVRSGQLTSAGPLTQQDIASMVFLAYTSEEMLDELRLRKSLDLTLPAADIDTDVSVEKSR